MVRIVKGGKADREPNSVRGWRYCKRGILGYKSPPSMIEDTYIRKGIIDRKQMMKEIRRWLFDRWTIKANTEYLSEYYSIIVHAWAAYEMTTWSWFISTSQLHDRSVAMWLNTNNHGCWSITAIDIYQIKYTCSCLFREKYNKVFKFNKSKN